jgi:hydroxyacylglutathione hydrolase
MNITPISAFSDNYIWALIDTENKVFDCIDPGEAEPVLQFAQSNQLQLRSIMITHHHNDHIGGVSQLKQYYPSCTVYGPTDSRITSITTSVSKDQIIPIGNNVFQVLSNPGHTSSHISYFENTNHWLFCGDTLFSAGCGRVFDGTLGQLHQSLLLFKSLPKNTLIFCAHEYTQQNLRFAQAVEPNNIEINNYIQSLQENPVSCTLPSSLARELLINPFLRTDQQEVQHYAQQHGAPTIQSLDVFRVLREQKNQFK